MIRQEIETVLAECNEQLSEEGIDRLTSAMKKYMEDFIELKKSVRDTYVNKISRKRELPELHGKKLHDFKNEFNTMFQTLGRLQFEDVTEPILYKLCLNFAWWGANNLKTNDYDKGEKGTA